jgi:tRNA pseudouridine38-40 synthase
MRKNFKLTIQYDGTDFHGWQVQAKGRTVQGDIENALAKIYPEEKINLIGAGRTDAGVHALALTANINLSSKLTSNQLNQALNGNLDRDIQISSITEVEENFHARFSATAREYEYRLVKYFSPINRHFSTTLKWDIDSEKIDKCVDLLLGEHDFSSFCKANAEVNNKICTVFVAKWSELNDQCIFTIKANRFLQHMVRFLVGTIIEVGRGRYSILDFQKLLNNESSNKTVVRAPSQGLFLKKVYYD